MNSPREGATLRELQLQFTSALCAPAHDAPACVEFAHEALADDGLPALARLRVYRNNTRLVQVDALGRTFAVVRRRLGEEYFDALANEYRAVHPSPRGDLHWIGQRFAPWLAERLAGSGYEWLADLARLEWACEQALVAQDAGVIALAELGRIPPEQLGEIRFALRPSLRTVSSPWPIWSVWKENQPDAAGRPVDLDLGAEHVIVACLETGLVLLSVAADECRFTAELAAGHTLAESIERSGLPVERLAPALGRLFDEGLVADLHASATGERA
ncbi:MAG TPA: DNA-binding domain-containing protein [Steroidobacteraceae bacterium]